MNHIELQTILGTLRNTYNLLIKTYFEELEDRIKVDKLLHEIRVVSDLVADHLSKKTLDQLYTLLYLLSKR